MKNLNRWLYMLAFSLVFLGNNFSAVAQATYTCDNIPYASHNGSNSVSFYTNNYVINNNYGYSDHYYYKITDATVTSVSTNDLSQWKQVYDFNASIYQNTFSINDVNLCTGNYKLWIMNGSCSSPVVRFSSFTVNTTAFSSLLGLTAVDKHNGKIDIEWSSSVNSQTIPVQYSVYKSSETPTIWTSTTSFFPNKIVNINKDQNGDPLVINQTYLVTAKYATGCAASPVSPVATSSIFSLDLCNQTVSNIQTVDLENGKINVSWTGTTPTPADGYAWAIHNNGFTPTYPADFRFTMGTTLTNVDTTFNNVNLVQGQNYKVTVIAVCDTNTSKSAKAYSDAFEVITCTSIPSNIIATQTGDSKMAISWTASSPAPADGYKYAVVNNNYNYTPSIGDYTASATTSVTNILMDFDGNTLDHMNTYTVYVLGSCAANSYSTAIDTMLTINNCTNVVTALNLTNAINGSLSLSWTAPTVAPTDGYAYAISKVGVTPNFPADFTPTVLTSITGISSTFDNNTVQNNVKYVAYVVSICDIANGISSLSVKDTVTFSTCQAAPTALSVTQNAGALTINFTGNSPADGYLYAVTPINTTILPAHYVQASASPITNVTASTNNMQPLAHNQTYIVSVKSACSLANNYVSPSVTSTITVNNCAAAPTNLVINTTTDLANISWTEPSTPPADGYMVYVGFNYNAVANYPNGFVSVLDTNGYQFQDNSDSYYVFVVSKCGTSHSTAISGNFSLVNCDENYMNFDETTTGVNGVSASWTYSGTSLPANGFAYAVFLNNGAYPSVFDDYTFIQNNMSVSNVMTTFNGDSLIEGNTYRIRILGVCDSVNEFYSSNENYFQFRKCSSPSNVQVWINADSTISATWENNNSTIANYLYAIGNYYGPIYPLFPINYTTTTNMGVTNIATTFDNQDFIPGNYYSIEVFAVCDVANNVISNSNGDDTYFDGQDCNSYTDFDAEYSNDELTITRDNNVSYAPAQGFQYAVIPTNVNMNDNFYKKFVPNSSLEPNTMLGITRNTVNNTLIVPNQSYRVYMRGVCDSLNGDFGYQDDRSFVATNVVNCNSVYDVVAIDNNNKSININWYYSGISTNGFEYAVLPIATTLQGSHFVATASAPVYNVYKTTSTGDSLVNGQAYAVYVRAKCSATTYSNMESTSITLYSTLSIADIASEDLVKVYPNPVTSNLTIEVPSATTENSTVTISDLTGKVISTSTLENAVTVLNVDDLVKGVYLISIDSKSIQKTIRIVKQ